MRSKPALFLSITALISILILCLFLVGPKAEPPLVVEGQEAEMLIGEAIKAAKNEDRKFFKKNKNISLVLPVAFFPVSKQQSARKKDDSQYEDIVKNKQIFRATVPVSNKEFQTLSFFIHHEKFTQELIHKPYINDFGWVCAKLTVNPLYLTDAKTTDIYGSLVFNVVQDSAIEMGENCEQLIQHNLVRIMKSELGNLAHLCRGWDEIEKGKLDSFFASNVLRVNEIMTKVYGHIDIEFLIELEVMKEKQPAYTAIARSSSGKVEVSYKSEDVQVRTSNVTDITDIRHFSVRFDDL